MDDFTILHMSDVAVEALAKGRLELDVPQSPATGRPLLCSIPWNDGGPGSHLGVDVLMLAAGDAFPMHTHPSPHLLFTVQGSGSVTVGGVVYVTQPGDLYLVNGEVEHSVGAGPHAPHVLMSFGAPHVHLDDPARMRVVADQPSRLERFITSALEAFSTGAGVWRTVSASHGR